MQDLAQAALAGGIPCVLAPKWTIPAKESILLITRVYALMAVNKVREAPLFLSLSLSLCAQIPSNKTQLTATPLGLCPESLLLQQDQYCTVADAMRAAVQSLLHDTSMKYEKSFFYWAAFAPQGFAGVRLDNALLDYIHHRLDTLHKPLTRADSQGGGES